MTTKKDKLKYTIDLLEDHPFELGLSAALVLFGIRSITTNLQSVPNSIEAQPHIVVFVYCALSILGGSSVIFGLFAQYKFAWAYGVERGGLFVSAAAWGSYIIGFLFSPVTPNSTLFMLALGGLLAGCLLRSRAIKRKSQATIAALREAKAAQEASG